MPLLDRIGIHIEVPSLKFRALSQEQPSESSETIWQRADQARQRQLERFQRQYL